MSTSKPDMGILFIKVVCYGSILYDVSMVWQNFNFYIENLNPRSLMSASEPAILKILLSFIYSYWGFVVSFVVGIISLIAAILTLFKLNIGRILLIISFYLVASLSVLMFLSNLNIIYNAYNTRTTEVKMVLGFFQFLKYSTPAILLLWIAQNLKSEPVKNLFHKKSVPVLAETL